MNFALWAIAIVPAWLVIRRFGNDDGQWDQESGGSNESPAALAEETFASTKAP
jgi:hypothetical protein